MGQCDDVDDWLFLTKRFRRDVSTPHSANFKVYKSSNSVAVEKSEGNCHVTKKAFLTFKELMDIHNKLLEFNINIPPFPIRNEISSWFWYFFQGDPILDNEACSEIAHYFKKLYSLIDSYILDHLIFMEDFDVDKYFKDLQNSNIEDHKKQVDIALQQLGEHLNDSLVIDSHDDLKKFYDKEDMLILEWQRALSQLYYIHKLPMSKIRDPTSCQSLLKKLHRTSTSGEKFGNPMDDLKVMKLNAECNIAQFNVEFFSKTVESHKSSLKRVEGHFKHFQEQNFQPLIGNRFERLSAEMSRDKMQVLLNQRCKIKLKLAYLKSQDDDQNNHKRCNDLKIKIYEKSLEMIKESLSNKLMQRNKLRIKIKDAYCNSEIFYDALMDFDANNEGEDSNNQELKIFEEAKKLEEFNKEISTLGSSIAKIRLKINKLNNNNSINNDKNNDVLTESIHLDMGTHHPGQVIFSVKRSDIQVRNVYDEEPLKSFVPPPPMPPPLLKCTNESSKLKLPPKQERELKENPKNEHFVMTLSMLSNAKSRLKTPTKRVQQAIKNASGFVVTSSQLANQIAKLKPAQDRECHRPKILENDQFNFLREALENIRITFDSIHEDEDQNFDDDFE